MKRLLALVVLLAGAVPALAQLRSIPVEAKRGAMSHVQGTVVELNGRPRQLAPGAQIRDASNLVIVPTALPAGSLVKYTTDANDMVSRVWILTPQEAAQPDAK